MGRGVYGCWQDVFSIALLCGFLALFTSVLHNVLLLYYVETFVSIYKIDKISFWVGKFSSALSEFDVYLEDKTVISEKDFKCIPNVVQENGLVVELQLLWQNVSDQRVHQMRKTATSRRKFREREHLERRSILDQLARSTPVSPISTPGPARTTQVS